MSGHPDIDFSRTIQVDMPQLPEGEDQDRYWAAVLKEKAGLELKIADVQDSLSSKIVEVEELKKKNTDFGLEIARLKNEKEEVERKVKYTTDIANTLSIDLAREKNDKRYVSNRVGVLSEENKMFHIQIKELSASKIGLEKSIARLKKDKEKVERSLAETESVIQNRIDDVLDIKSTLDRRLRGTSEYKSKNVELSPIIVSAQSTQKQNLITQQTTSTPGFNARILSINEENNFVILDVGENSGIRPGDALSVYRNEKYIAGLEVIQVRKDISAADIKNTNTKIRSGDIVR